MGRSESISEAIDFLLKQLFTDFELLIADNVSTDRATGSTGQWMWKRPAPEAASIVKHWFILNYEN